MTVKNQMDMIVLNVKKGDFLRVLMEQDGWKVIFSGVLTTDPYYHNDGSEEISAGFAYCVNINQNNNVTPPVWNIEHHAEQNNVYFGTAKQITIIRKM